MSEEQVLQEIEKLSPHDAYIRGRCDMWDAISSNDRKEMLADIEQILRNLERAKSMTKPNKWIDADVLDKIRAEIIKYEGDCRLSVDEYPSCKQCTDNTFETIYAILDKYKAESEG